MPDEVTTDGVTPEDDHTPDPAEILAEVHEAVRKGRQANDAALNVLGPWLHGKNVDPAELARLSELRAFVSADIAVFVERALAELAR